MAYTKVTDFEAKDALLSGNPAKLIKGVEIDDEFDAIQVADALNAKGAASSTDNAVARFDGATGKALQNSVMIVDDTGGVTGVTTLTGVTTVDTTSIEVTNVKAKNGTASATIADATGVMTIASSVLTTTDINGGTIDATVIGGGTAAAGTFTALTATGNTALGDAEATDTHAIKGATTLLANSASAALTITQTGAGNAIFIEDSVSVDATPFVVTAAGAVGIGEPSPSEKLVVSGNANGDRWRGLLQDAASPAFSFTTDTDTGMFGGGTNILGFATGGTEKLRIASDGTTTLGGTSTAPNFKVGVTASAVNYITAYGRGTGLPPYLIAEGSDTDIGLVVTSKGAESVRLFTRGGNDLQVLVSPTASANRYITLTGSNGGNPTIGVSAGTLALSAGALATSATLGLGYGTGAGGTVTQITSKATAVTLNTLAGRITMEAGALGATTTTQFTFNNSTITSADVLILNIYSGASSAGINYNVWVGNVGTGAAAINVRNISGGSLSEAVVIQFVVIKGAAS